MKIHWKKLGRAAVAALPVVLMGAAMAHAQTATPTVQYGTPNSAVATTVNAALEGVATTIRWILGGTALVAILIAAFMNHMPNPRSKEMAKEVLGAAIIGLLIAAFAPQIVNWVATL